MTEENSERTRQINADIQESFATLAFTFHRTACKFIEAAEAARRLFEQLRDEQHEGEEWKQND